jgi:hypothetical protein
MVMMLLPLPLPLYLNLLLVLMFTSGEIVNLVTHQPVTNIWFEVGFAKISNVDWVSISTFQTTFSKPLIFISHPDLSSTANFPAVPRLRNILQTGGKVSFQTKLYLPNDSYCSKQWYIPQYIQPAKQASWAVFESGAYNVSGRPLYLSDGPIYRLYSLGLCHSSLFLIPLATLTLLLLLCFCSFVCRICKFREGQPHSRLCLSLCPLHQSKLRDDGCGSTPNTRL